MEHEQHVSGCYMRKTIITKIQENIMLTKEDKLGYEDSAKTDGKHYHFRFKKS